jgi:hypothetical protein
MNLKILGFDNIDIVADADTYRRDVWKDKRPLGGVCISATLPDEPKTLASEEDIWINEYEIGLENEVLPRAFVEPLYRFFCLQDSGAKFTGNLKTIHDSLTLKDNAPSVDESLLPDSNNGKFALEIIKNWRYSPYDKIALEYGKLLKHEGDLDEAIKVLKDVTTNKINSDWRTVYRSFHLLYLIYSELKNDKKSIKYKKLCIKSNYKFPVNHG